MLVTGFRATYVGATNVELSWNSNDCNTEYKVGIKELGMDEIVNYNTTKTTKDHHIEINDLTSNVTYEFTLCGNNGINITTGFY